LPGGKWQIVTLSLVPALLRLASVSEVESRCGAVV